ncbi:MAG: hypothetical protein IM572_06300 [Chitinophagaceae bacterium]|nr:hypothetical protein [Microcystis sp. M065S1]MCA6492269.1 hypothetical protein [Chitinophagaceae bacterium]
MPHYLSFIETYNEKHEDIILCRPGWFTLLQYDEYSDFEGYRNLIDSLKRKGYIIKKLSFDKKMSISDCHKKMHRFFKSISRKTTDTNHVVIIESLERLVHNWGSYELMTVIYGLRMQAQIYNTHIIAEYEIMFKSSEFIHECTRQNFHFESTQMISSVFSMRVRQSY